MQEMYNITEFSKMCGVSVSQLRRWHANGKLVPHVNLSGYRKYSEANLMKVLMELKRN